MRYLRIIGMIAFFAASSACYAEDSASKNDSASSTTTEKSAAKGANSATTTKEATQQEHAAFLRRLAVCSKLREVATSTNNRELQNYVEKLEDRAAELYQQKLKAISMADMDKREKEANAEAKKSSAKATPDVRYAPNGRPIRQEANQ
ncbi:hypothetical protein KIH39_12410 [Telmatocola sphagniphila]|uniref:Uncharacterized protein n=1 Tax=Telmatocola sphagniphila TaxID=1123043 RepID=A0A8E6BBG3_9BACT|nr:hypothetical protein [Telmatocola sphagniphila]QVL34671.1 hypothetical protein KIH39_12410 [Telmatocola sphagniphila]